MTFNEWLDEYYPSSERPDDPNYYLIVALKAAWNAAVEACIDEISFAYNLEFDDRKEAAALLQGLKT